MSGMSFVFYDTETTGIETDFDQIVQFAAIKTDGDLNEIERFEIRSQLLPYVIPSPGALRVTKMPIARLIDPQTPSHYDMIRAMRAKLLEWSPSIFLGYNSLQFDEKMLRQALYQTLHNPYLTNRDGNCRGDVLALVQSVSELSPACLTVPMGDKGKRVYKLDRLAPANGFAHDNAHDALADVEATIHMCRLVRDGAPDIWSNFLRFTQKSAVSDFLAEQEPFLLTEFYFANPYHMPVVSIGEDAEQSNVSVCFVLSHDLSLFRAMTDAQLQQRLKASPKPLRKIKANAAPSMTPLDDSLGYFLGGMSISDIRAKAAELCADRELTARLLAAYEAVKPQYEASPHIEGQMYDGFASSVDERIMSKFHVTPWEDRHLLISQFEDARFQFIAKRIVYARDPNHLPDPYRAEIAAHIRSRIAATDVECGKWTTITNALAECDKELANCDADGILLIEAYRVYLIQRASSLN